MELRASGNQLNANRVFEYIRDVTPYDCEFIIEGKSVEAHKIILRSVSPFFDVIISNFCLSASYWFFIFAKQAVFKNQEESNAENPILFPGVEFDDLLQVFNLIYYGKTSLIEEQRMETIAETSNLLGICFGSFVVHKADSPRYLRGISFQS